MTDTAVKMNRVHIVSTTAQYFYRWPGGRDKVGVHEGHRGHEEEGTMEECKV